jgi:predicted RNA-binding Zn-ribbon protein involved in translation (DUF1610 family)
MATEQQKDRLTTWNERVGIASGILGIPGSLATIGGLVLLTVAYVKGWLPGHVQGVATSTPPAAMSTTELPPAPAEQLPNPTLSQEDAERVVARIRQELSKPESPQPTPTSDQPIVETSSHLSQLSSDIVPPTSTKWNFAPSGPVDAANEVSASEKELAAFRQAMKGFVCRRCKTENWNTQEFLAHHPTYACKNCGFEMRSVGTSMELAEQERRLIAKVQAKR